MSAVIGISIDMDDDESGDREAGDCLDELTAAFLAAAVPVELGFANA
jgi:hypothetical protein